MFGDNMQGYAFIHGVAIFFF